jgi:Cu/Ag efflux protein CusF
MASIKALFGGIALLVLLGVNFSLSAKDRPSTGAAARGEVTKVDLATGRITIKHGPISSLGMNAAQAVDDFQAYHPMMLNALRPGEKINFTAGRVNGQPATDDCSSGMNADWSRENKRTLYCWSTNLCERARAWNARTSVDCAYL